MSFIDDDVALFFGGLDAVGVAFDGHTCMGNFDTPSNEFDMGGPMSSVESQRYCISIPANAFNPPPDTRQGITVAGRTYTIARRKLSEDGRIYTLELAR